MKLLNLFVISIAMLQSAVGQAPQGPDRVAKLIEQTRDTQYRVAALHELAAIGPEVIPSVLAESRRDGTYDLSVLSVMGSSATPTLIALLDDPQFGGMALNPILVMKDPRALSKLREILVSTTDEQTRESIIGCLSGFKDDSALQILEELMAHKDSRTRQLAADALASSQIASFAQIANAFRVNPGHSGRYRLSGTEEGRRLLMSHVRQGGPLAKPALEALAFSPPDDVPFLKGFLFGPDDQMREAAGKVLGALGTPAACQVLIDAHKALPKGHYLEPNLIAAAGIAEARGTQSLLEPWLRSHVKRSGALAVLAKWHPDDKSLLPLLRERINSPDTGYKEQAIATLLTMRTGGEIPILIEAFQSAKRDQEDFIEALGKTKDPACLSFLKDLYERDPKWRSPVLRALGLLPSDNVEEFLCSKLKDPDPRVRNQAIASCGRARLAAAVPQLCVMLDSQTESKENEERIVGALSSIATSGSIKSIRAYMQRNLRDSDGSLRSAITAISTAGGEPAFEALSQLYKSLAPYEQEAVLFAMGRLDSKGVIPFLERVVNDPLEYVLLRHRAGEMIVRQKGRTTTDRVQ